MLPNGNSAGMDTYGEHEDIIRMVLDKDIPRIRWMDNTRRLERYGNIWPRVLFPNNVISQLCFGFKRSVILVEANILKHTEAATGTRNRACRCKIQCCVAQHVTMVLRP